MDSIPMPVPAKKVRIGFAIDRSGSMEPLRNEVVTGFNEQVDAINKNATEDTKVSLVTFATTVKEHFINEPVAKLEKLTTDKYVPSGWTALNDAVAHLISRLEQSEDANDPNTAFLITVISDGAENQSKEFAGHKGRLALASKIKSLQDTGRWTFTYLGANQDMAQVSQELNIPIQNTQAFAASAGGTRSAMHLNKTATEMYLGSIKKGSKMSVADFYSQG